MFSKRLGIVIDSYEEALYHIDEESILLLMKWLGEVPKTILLVYENEQQCIKDLLYYQTSMNFSLAELNTESWIFHALKVKKLFSRVLIERNNFEKKTFSLQLLKYLKEIRKTSDFYSDFINTRVILDLDNLHLNLIFNLSFIDEVKKEIEKIRHN